MNREQERDYWTYDDVIQRIANTYTEMTGETIDKDWLGYAVRCEFGEPEPVRKYSMFARQWHILDRSEDVYAD